MKRALTLCLLLVIAAFGLRELLREERPGERPSEPPVSPVRYDTPPPEWPCRVTKDEMAVYSYGCTELGCVDGLFLSISASEGWKPGRYRYDIDLGERQISCEGELSAGSRNQAPTFGCAGDDIIAFTGRFEELVVARLFPRVLRFRIFRDGRLSALAQIEPAYIHSNPNGPGCGLGCCAARENVTIGSGRPEALE